MGPCPQVAQAAGGFRGEPLQIWFMVSVEERSLPQPAEASLLPVKTGDSVTMKETRRPLVNTAPAFRSRCVQMTFAGPELRRGRRWIAGPQLVSGDGNDALHACLHVPRTPDLSLSWGPDPKELIHQPRHMLAYVHSTEARFPPTPEANAHD